MMEIIIRSSSSVRIGSIVAVLLSTCHIHLVYALDITITPSTNQSAMNITGGTPQVENTDVNITLNPSNSSNNHGIFVSGQGSKGIFGGNIIITNDSGMGAGAGQHHSGFYINKGGEVATGGDITINTSLQNSALYTKDQAHGIFVGADRPDGGTISTTSLTSTFTMDTSKKLTITTSGVYSAGAIVNGNAKAILGAVEITTHGDTSVGLYSANNSNVDSEGGKVITNGNGSSALRTSNSAAFQNDAYRTRLTVHKFIELETSGTTSHGIDAINYGDIILNAGGEITTNNTAAHGVYIDNHGTATVSGKLDVQTKMSGSYGLYLKADSKFDGQGLALGSKISSIDSAIRFEACANGAVCTGEAKAILHNTTITSQGNAGAATINVVGGQNNQLDLSNSTVSSDTGYMLAVTDNSNASTEFTLNADKGTVLNGKTVVSYFVVGGLSGTAGNINLTNQSVWNMTSDSNITNLNNTDSLVKFTSYQQQGTYSTLTVDNLLSGKGSFAMSVDIEQGLGDKLVINNATGNHHLLITNDGSADTDGTEILNVVTVTGTDNANFTSNQVELGGYLYGIKHDDSSGLLPNSQWSLYGSKKLSPSASATGNFSRSTYLLSYIDTQTLMQRMGDIRNLPEHDGNFWMRSFGGKLNAFSGSSLDGFKMNYYGLQAGVDKLVASNNAGRFYLGTMVGYTYGDPDYSNGSGTAKDYNLGLYGSYISNNGFYIDGILKYMYTRNHFNVTDSLGQNITGSANSSGYGASVEVGKRFQVDGPVYIEPQLQLSYHHQKKVSSNVSNGLKVKLGHYDSILGRTGTLIGYDWKKDDNSINTYLKVGYVREIAGKNTFYLNKSKEKYDFGGGWVETGIGVSAQHKNHSVFGEVSYANGNRFDKQQVNFGYRYQF